MSFFKDFKDDFSQAVNELMPGENTEKEEFDDDSDMVVNTLESELDVESELSKLDGLLEKVTKDVKEPKLAAQSVSNDEPRAAADSLEPKISLEPKAVSEPVQEPIAEPVPKAIEKPKTFTAVPDERKEAVPVTAAPEKAAPVTAAPVTAAPVMPAAEQNNQKMEGSKEMEENKMVEELNSEITQMETKAAEMPLPGREVSDEVAIITEGTNIRGNMESTGSLDIRGTIDGNVACNGKLVVTGVINGNSTSSEFFADAAKIEGEVVSTGTVKVGLGSIIIGNITATSAVIAGAIKGDIDVQGPVVVDTSAVVMGNIKSRSVQINNGAVIEGFCSQCYAEIDVESLFGEKKVK